MNNLDFLRTYQNPPLPVQGNLFGFNPTAQLPQVYANGLSATVPSAPDRSQASLFRGSTVGEIRAGAPATQITYNPNAAPPATYGPFARTPQFVVRAGPNPAAGVAAVLGTTVPPQYMGGEVMSPEDTRRALAWYESHQRQGRARDRSITPATPYVAPDGVPQFGRGDGFVDPRIITGDAPMPATPSPVVFKAMTPANAGPQMPAVAAPSIARPTQRAPQRQPMRPAPVGSVREGANANIDDETRRRAMQALGILP